MAISVSELCDALVEAGVSKEAARKAAEAVIPRHGAEPQLATRSPSPSWCEGGLSCSA